MTKPNHHYTFYYLSFKEKNRGKERMETLAYKEYLAGLLAGVATVITGHPFDTVKVIIFDLGIS